MFQTNPSTTMTGLATYTVSHFCELLHEGEACFKEPLFAGGEPAGFVTSAAFGCTLGRSIAYAWLPPELGSLGTQVEVQYLGERHPATVAADPLFDPEMPRMRS